MGETRAKLKIYGVDGEAHEFEALVDTGATFTKISKSLASSAGFKAEREVEVRLADSRVVKRWLGQLEVELEGVRGRIPVTIGGEEETPLIGYTTLEVLGFKVNPITGKLEKTVAIEYADTQIAGRLAWHARGANELIKRGWVRWG